MPSPARSVFMAFLALYIVTCAFVLDYRVVEAILSGHADDVSNNTLLGVLLSAWNSAALGVIVGFFYGRSSDSDRKTELIGASTPPAARRSPSRRPRLWRRSWLRRRSRLRPSSRHPQAPPRRPHRGQYE